MEEYCTILIAECAKSTQIVAVYFVKNDDEDGNMFDFMEKLAEVHDVYPTVTIIEGTPYHTRMVCNAINSLDISYDLPKAYHACNNVAVKVYNNLKTIPKGETRTYSEIARQIGHPNEVGLVVDACNKNNLAYIVPCHRAVSGPNLISGYRWGVEKKRQLLIAEGFEFGRAAM